MSAEEDPHRLIYDWTNHFNIPKWAEDYSKCKHCQEALKSGHKHNCRLCGELFCSACTGKYHVPVIFRQKKNKDGPARVCHGCRDSCLAEKKKAEFAAKGAVILEEKQKKIYPPEWVPLETYVNCPKCLKKGGKAHNCRTCGKLFCSDCTRKMQVPPIYEKKKKAGPSRVCDECRFLIIGGAKLVECSREEELKNDYAERVGFMGRSIIVRFEGDSRVLWQAPVEDHTNLKEIDLQFRQEAPQNERYQYVFRGERIPKVFYDVFTAKIFGQYLHIVPDKAVVASLAPIMIPVSQHASAQPLHQQLHHSHAVSSPVVLGAAAGLGAAHTQAMLTGSPVTGVPDENNPFKSKANPFAKRADASPNPAAGGSGPATPLSGVPSPVTSTPTSPTTESPAKSTFQAPKAFSRPQISRPPSVNIPTSPKVTPPPIPSGAISPILAVNEADDPFKARAKAFAAMQSDD